MIDHRFEYNVGDTISINVAKGNYKMMVDFNIVSRFLIPHIGWEMDNEGYIVKDGNGLNKLALSNHGRYYLADREELNDFINNTRDILDYMIKNDGYLDLRIL